MQNQLKTKEAVVITKQNKVKQNDTATPTGNYNHETTWHSKEVKIGLLSKHMSQPKESELGTQNGQKPNKRDTWKHF